MSRPVVVLVDPQRFRRRQHEDALTGVYDVVPAANATAAQGCVDRWHPAAVVIALRQDGEHGLDLCRNLRASADGLAAFILVHGAPAPGLAHRLRDRAKVEKHFSVDRFVSRELEAADLLAILQAKIRVARSPTRDPASIAPVKLRSARLPGTEPDPTLIDVLQGGVSTEAVKTLLTTPVGMDVIDDPPAGADWKTLLRARATPHNLSRMLTKEVTEIKDLSDRADDDITWGELLQARVSMQNLKRLLKKDIGFGGAKTEAPAPPPDAGQPGD